MRIHLTWLIDPWRESRERYLRAWLERGFTPQLWHLGQLGTPPTAPCELRDATEIVESSPIKAAFMYERKFRIHAACADLLRYELLVRFGGPYADIDVMPREVTTTPEPEPRFERDRRGRLEIRFIAGPAGHELFVRLRDEAVRREESFIARGGYRTKRDLVRVLWRTGPTMATQLAQRWALEHGLGYRDLLLPRVIDANTFENRKEHYSRRWPELRQLISSGS